MNFDNILITYIIFETHIKLEKERDSVRDLKGQDNDKIIYIPNNDEQNYPLFKTKLLIEMLTLTV